MNSELFDERFAPLVDRCRPLKVSVKLRQVKDRYYIDFDGSKSYTDVNDWTTYWLGFDRFAVEGLRLAGFKHDEVKLKDPCHATAFIGTLFEFLTKTHE